MERKYIIAITTDLNGKHCTEPGTGGIFWLDNRLSSENQMLKAEEQIRNYKKIRPHVEGFIISSLKNAPIYTEKFFKVE